MYKNANDLMELCQSRNRRIWQIGIECEQMISNLSEEEILSSFENRLDIMIASATKALDTRLSTKGGLIDGVSNKQNVYSKGNTISGEFINYVMALAYSSSEVNASMGKICAAPTAGSCGILPAVLLGVMEEKNIAKAEVVKGLVLAGVIGAIYTRNATVAGADGGCQAECGVAASMAAAAAAFMCGAEDQVALNAAGFAMINVMGLVCDPVAGLVALPCAQRNASGAINAIIAADMAMAGQVAHIPFDQVVQSMFKVGKMLPPQLRETAQGGIAATEAGEKINKMIFKS